MKSKLGWLILATLALALSSLPFSSSYAERPSESTIGNSLAVTSEQAAPGVSTSPSLSGKPLDFNLADRFLNKPRSDGTTIEANASASTLNTLAGTAFEPFACGLDCPQNIIRASDPNQCGAVVNYPAPTTSGVCGTVTCSPASGTFYPRGTTTVTCSNTADSTTCNFTITVVDAQFPVITAPPNQTKSNDPDQCGAVVNFPAPTISDNCLSLGPTVCLPASGSTFAVGNSTVTCRTSDGNECGNIFAVDLTNNLVRFGPTTPGSVSSRPLTGLLAGQNVLAIDFRPATGQLFGLLEVSGGFRIITINVGTGAVNTVGSTFTMPGSNFGFDFNPTVDRIRITSNDEANLSVNPDNGVVTVQTPLNPGDPNIVGSAYSNNVIGATTTVLYGIDSNSDMLVIQNPPANGTLTNVGLLGVDAVSQVGFDISQCTGIAYAAINIGGTFNLYTINLTNGHATLVGTITGSAGFRGLSVDMPRTSYASMQVTVNDTQPPAINCPNRIVATESAPGSSSAMVNITPPGTDNCPGASLACTPPSGSFFPLGSTSASCTATDASGNNATCGISVKVIAQPPLTFFLAVDTSNNLLRFASNAPSSIISTTPITGLQGGEQIVGIDRRPATGQLYGLSQLSRLYLINPVTGFAAQVGSDGGFTLSGTSFGFDFNPTVDRIRVISDADQNLRLNPVTGALAATDTTLAFAAGDANVGQNPEATGAAYTNNFAGATTTTLYDIDTNRDVLVTQNPPNNGTLNTVAQLGLDVSGVTGFDINSSGGTETAFAALQTTGNSGLYLINLGTGESAFMGQINGGAIIRGLTVMPTALAINDVSVTEGDAGSTNATFTVTLTDPSTQTILVDYVTANGSAAEPGDFTAVNGTLTFGPGETSKIITVPVNGDLLQEGNETFSVNLSNASGAVIADNQGTGTILDNEPSLASFGFSASSYGVIEDCTALLVTVNRSGSLTNPMTVDYATSNGSASDRTDYTFAAGRLQFAAGEASKQIPILITEDSFVEGTESATITLSNPAGGGTLGSPTTASIVIIDDLSEPAANPIDNSMNFVCQQYHDFLNRQADAGGLAFWTNNIESCGADAACREAKRVDTSAAFFLSIEFQESGALVARTYRAALNRRALIGEFLPDTQEIGRGVIVGQGAWEAQLEANKVAYFNGFVTRPGFIAVFGGLTNEQYVDALNSNSGGALSPAERNALVAGLNGATETRATVLRKVAQDADFVAGQFNQAFVLMQYLGYLRRDPDEPGFQFWLAKLNTFGGDFRKADMVKAFLTSGEYRTRFGP